MPEKSGNSSVCRVFKNGNYTVMSNQHLRSMNLSLKAIGLLSKILALPNNWDYSVAGIVKICKENETAVKSALNELREWGYLKVTKLMPNQTESGRIEYVYDFFEVSDIDTDTAPKQRVVSESHKTAKQGIEKQGIENLHLEILPVEIQGVENQGQINTNKSNTKKTNTDYQVTINQSYPQKIVNYKTGDRIDVVDNSREKYRKLIYQNIDYEYLGENYDTNRIDEIVEIMLDVICSTKDTMRVNGENISTEIVKSRFLKLNSNHIAYVFDAMKKSPSDIRNIHAYLVTTLYNAPSTIDNYYTALVNYDMHG